MPQTRFVTRKALALGLKPIVVVNKIDRENADPQKAVNATFELFDKLGATDEQLDFPIVYASGFKGYAGLEDTVREGNMEPLFDAILKHVRHEDDGWSLQLQITSLEYSSYVGKIGVGRILRGPYPWSARRRLDERSGRQTKQSPYQSGADIQRSGSRTG
jgi:GTP-binding protein